MIPPLVSPGQIKGKKKVIHTPAIRNFLFYSSDFFGFPLNPLRPS
jgi:hypothetical protein